MNRMPKKIKLKKLDDEQNEKIRTLAKGVGYADKRIDAILKKIDVFEPDFLDAQRFLSWGFKENKIDKILELTSNEELTKLKEVNHYIKRGRQLKPKKINDMISLFNRAITSYTNGLEDIKKRKWNPKTKTIEIPLEGGEKKLITFKNAEEFNRWLENDIDNVSKHIEHDENEVKDWERIKKFKKVIQ